MSRFFFNLGGLDHTPRTPPRSAPVRLKYGKQILTDCSKSIVLLPQVVTVHTKTHHHIISWSVARSYKPVYYKDSGLLHWLDLHKEKKFLLQDLSLGKWHHDHTRTTWADSSKFHLDVKVFFMYLSWSDLIRHLNSKHSINLDGQSSSENFKAQFLGRRNIGIVKKKNWWLLFMYYRGTKTINPSGLFEKFT